jgi:hypothetical protein
MDRTLASRLRAGILAAPVAALGLLVAASASASPLASEWVANTSGMYSFQSISNPNDPSFDQLLGINNLGLIVGYYGSGASPAHPNKGFLVPAMHSTSSFVNENYPGAAQTQVVAVTSTGNTGGFWIDAKGNNHGFIQWNGVYTTVDDPLAAGKTKTTQILGLNAAGVAVGFYNDAHGTPHAFKYNSMTRAFTPLTPPNAQGAVATGINAQDEITGYLTRGKATVGFLVSHARYNDFDLPGSTNTQPFGINNRDEIVGSYVDAKGQMHGFVLTDPTTRATFKTIDDPSGVGSTVINGVNGSGQLVGFYQNSAKNTVGFLARP